VSRITTILSAGEQVEDPTNRVYLDIAAKLGLGVSDRAKIDLQKVAIPRS
jgi:hypothetical protein